MCQPEWANALRIIVDSPVDNVDNSQDLGIHSADDLEQTERWLGP